MMRGHYPPPPAQLQFGAPAVTDEWTAKQMPSFVPPPARRPARPLARLTARPLARLLLPVALALAAVSSGCVYRVNIQQGNFLDAKAVEQVAVGMTRSQVRFLLGTPMIADPFHPERWDYLYYTKEGRTQKVERRHFVIFFEEEKVARIERPSGEFKNPKLPAPTGA
jgi:outer membrane protein assembly factor BamE